MAERVGASWRLPWEPLVLAALLLAGWELSARGFSIPEYLLPRPLGIVETMATEAGRMLPHLALTLGEALAGFAGGVLLGVVVAFGLASSAFLRRELQPLIVFSQSMPTAALAPLLIVWFGLGVVPKALLALLLVFFPIAANLTEGLTQVNPDMLRLLRSYRATRWQTFVKLRLPHAVGYLVAGMKIAAPLALIGAVVGEFVGANRGIGFVILDAAARLATVEMLAGIVYVGLTGTALFLGCGGPGAPARALARGAAMRGSLAVSVIVAWELAVRLLAVPDYLLPPPSSVAVELIARFALVARHAAVTLGEVARGPRGRGGAAAPCWRWRWRRYRSSTGASIRSSRFCRRCRR